MTAPQEGTVAGDGLDREAVRRLSDVVNGYYTDDRQVDVTVAEAGAILLAREVPALIAALKAAEAEVARLRRVADAVHGRHSRLLQEAKRLRAYIAALESEVAGSMPLSALVHDDRPAPALRTEGGAS